MYDSNDYPNILCKIITNVYNHSSHKNIEPNYFCADHKINFTYQIPYNLYLKVYLFIK
jgi:hypothetical protein